MCWKKHQVSWEPAGASSWLPPNLSMSTVFEKPCSFHKGGSSFCKRLSPFFPVTLEYLILMITVKNFSVGRRSIRPPQNLNSAPREQHPTIAMNLWGKGGKKRYNEWMKDHLKWMRNRERWWTVKAKQTPLLQTQCKKPEKTAYKMNIHVN